MQLIDIVEGLLKQASCDGYSITCSNQIGYEAYFVKEDIDIIRAKDIQSCKVTVYVDCVEEDIKYRGSADVLLNAAYSEEEMLEKINEACVLASYVKEPYYTLPEGFIEHQEKQTSNLKNQLTEISNALKRYEVEENEVINSFEVFANETLVELRNSNGLQVEYVSNSNSIEVIVNVSKEGHEIEIYHADTFAHKSSSEIYSELKKILKYGQDKMVAGPLEADINRVVICDRDVRKLINYFTHQINAYSLYSKISTHTVGETFFNNPKGDVVTYKVFAKAEGATSNAPCNSDGIRLKDATLIESGKVTNITGHFQYGQYLGLEVIPNQHYMVEGGKYSESELKKSPYLECVEFSDFSVDNMSGDFAGEIRLAYYFDGNTITPIKGGSVSGNIKKLGQSMYFSKETNTYDGNVLPKCVFIDGASVAKGV